MDSNQRQQTLRRIGRAARWTALRLRLSDALRAAVAWLPVPLLVGIVSLVVIKLRRLDWHDSRPYLFAMAAGLLLLFAAVGYQMLRRRARNEGALALDRYYGLHDRLTNALCFSALPPEKRTPLMELAIDDGCSYAPKLRSRKAAPIQWPPMLALPLVLSCILGLIAVVEVRSYQTVAQTKPLEGVTLAADDIDYFRDATKEMAQQKHEASMQAALDKFNQLVEDIANKRLDRTEAFRRMEALERELRAGSEADKKALEDALGRIAEELRKSDLTKSTADALRDKDLPKAQQELKQLAQRMRQNPKGFNKAELDKLRAALEKASKDQKERLEALQRQRDELAKEQESLLKRKKESPDGGLDEQDERLLHRKERELERLDRQLQEQQAAARQLERLDRELAQAAADLMRDLGLSAQDLDQGAEDLNRMAQEQMTQQEKEELRQRIDELRELLRQQGQGGKARMVQMRRFSQRAHGQRGGQSGQGQRGQGQQPGQEGEEEGEEGGQQGQGRQGQNGQGGGEQVWVIGPNGKPMLVMQGGGSGSGSQSSGGGSQPGGEGQGTGGKDWGTGHDPNLTGKATNPKMGTQDVELSGVDTGEGPSRAQVISGAAERGFVGRSYKRVFTEYHTEVERSIDKEQVPPGYRFYVQRYFQLIRPRE